ncbi:high nitrogen upregulated cytochrome P450 monooxygenase 2 [Mycena albidolilacea]|uniref:High nitrogen upregulated cytochrome P450 monooxygenase 2 n=1 Tax=Mycena albidolilacea TaxID=1033008 RepID=A0AAD7EC90_9AGAR|nr:high nitrogen upregulated cytochrome P450 monooxygenase 2 [Mycena albidolilacea]
MHSPWLIWGVALGLVNHFCFHKYEPSGVNVTFPLLAVQPIALLMFVEGPFTFMGLAWSYAVFLGSLSLSIAAYGLSPFHPLAQYPGPAIGKVTKLWGFWKTSQGHKYIYHKKLHDTYGPYVRTGPNKISVIDPPSPAVCQILNFGGLEKGRYYESGRHPSIPPSVVCISGEAHTKKRRVWNRAMTSSSFRDYEPLVSKRASQHGPVDLGNWLNFFAFDLMGDLAFGGGFEHLRDGEDTGGLGERIRGASYLSGQLPWIINTLHLFPRVGRIIQDCNDFGQHLAMQRMKDGAVGTMDLWYHLADEAGTEKQKPTFEESAADGIVAIIAASDTVASTMCSLVWFLLSDPEYYRRVQQELDNVFVDGDDPLEVSKHQELHFLSACMHETLRLHPPIPSNGARQVHLHQPGRNIAGRFIPSGTSVYTPTYSLHRNPHYFFPHPDKFCPQRWLPDSKFDKHDTSAFAPFSLGPANCVGQKFGNREILMASSILFKSFDLQFADGFDSDAWPKSMRDFFVFTRGPLLVNLTPRHRN